MKKYIAFDIGGTMIKYAIMSESEEVLEYHVVETEAKRGGTHVISRISAIIEKYLVNTELDGICISTSGVVDVETGKIINANENFPEYTGIEIKKTLESRFNIPCEVENDVVCVGLAEHHSGAAAGSRIAVCVTIGTGVGGCIIIDGNVFRGASYSAGEVGYMLLPWGVLEKEGSTAALVRRVAHIKGVKQEEFNGFSIMQLAKEGDQVCIDAIDSMCDALGCAIANICYVLNPDVVVIGGGISAEKEYLYDKIRNAMERYLIPNIAKHTQLRFATHTNQSGVLGAHRHFVTRQSLKNAN